MMINARTQKAEREKDGYYEEFVEKFKPKKTTDDCMTPEPVYQAVLDWAKKEYGIGPEARILRPFWPGADYQTVDYSGDCVVIDNPPFSILSAICNWYQERGIRFFMFAPTLTLFSTARGTLNYVISGETITYENGAKVCTSFVTNMGGYKIHCAPDLYDVTKAANTAVQNALKTKLPKYKYPSNVCSGALLQSIPSHGAELKIRAEDAHFIRALDSQKENEDKAIYGSGFLLSDAAAEAAEAAAKRAAEAAAEAAAKANARVWELSERERKIVAQLSGACQR